MTLENWKKEFYPITANEFVGSSKTEKDYIEHSLLKWTGLLPENLAKHDVEKGSFYILDKERIFGIHSLSCVLCEVYDNKTCGTDDFVSPGKCPLVKVLGNRCDSKFVDHSVYVTWIEEDDPKPMIEALQKALEMCNELD